jgi:hypothetical protein
LKLFSFVIQKWERPRVRIPRLVKIRFAGFHRSRAEGFSNDQEGSDHAQGEDHHRSAGKANPPGSGKRSRPGSRIPPGTARPDLRGALDHGKRPEAFQRKERRLAFPLSPGENFGGKTKGHPGHAEVQFGCEKISRSDPTDHGHVIETGSLADTGKGLFELREGDGDESIKSRILSNGAALFLSGMSHFKVVDLS